MPTDAMIAGSAMTTTYVSAAPSSTPAAAKPSRRRAPGEAGPAGVSHLSLPGA